MEDTKRIILITGAGGKLLRYDKPRRQLERYSQIHNFKFKFKEFKKNYKLEKLKIIKKFLILNYTVIWVDYDITVNNYEKNIMKNLNSNNYIFITGHYIKPNSIIRELFSMNNDYFYVENSGVMIFRNSVFSTLFVDDMIKLTEKYYLKMSCWNDNSALLNLVGKKNLIALFSSYRDSFKLAKVPDLQLSNSDLLIGKLDIIFNSIPKINKITKDTVFIHYAGIKNKGEYLK